MDWWINQWLPYEFDTKPVYVQSKSNHDVPHIPLITQLVKGLNWNQNHIKQDIVTKSKESWYLLHLETIKWTIKTPFTVNIPKETVVNKAVTNSNTSEGEI